MPKGVYKHKPLSEEHKKKLSLAKINSYFGENNPSWKGDKVGYYGLHCWVRKQLGKANHCEECGLDKIPDGMKRYFQWANKSHKYKRDLKDWKQMCIKCHKQYDK